ncbi:hypothetical protein EQO05_15070 [Methanosarcina sp. MSH10X1]|nr:hypothetical protein EQO05_15070 [Methanosarcina sp. MSH10X1]
MLSLVQRFDSSIFPRAIIIISSPSFGIPIDKGPPQNQPEKKIAIFPERSLRKSRKNLYDPGRKKVLSEVSSCKANFLFISTFFKILKRLIKKRASSEFHVVFTEKSA